MMNGRQIFCVTLMIFYEHAATVAHEYTSLNDNTDTRFLRHSTPQYVNYDEKMRHLQHASSSPRHQSENDDVSVSERTRCTWLPSCICRDESSYTNGTYKLMVNCTSSGLKVVPTYIPSNTTVLTLDGNSIKSLTPGIFKNLTILKYLDLSNNEITSLDFGVFEGLNNLLTLELDENKIRYTASSFPEGIFKPLVSLHRLNLRQKFHNVLNDERLIYPVNALVNLTNLRQLLIDGIDSNFNGTAFSKMSYVESLTLTSQYGRCRLKTTTPGMFNTLKSVVIMDISNCSLVKVEENSFCELKSLSEIDLSHNTDLGFKSLRNITAGLQSQKLRLLNLNNIHTRIGDCTRLRVDDMQNMKNMSVETISLDFNRLAYIEENAVHYIPQNITQLSLSNNMLLPANYVREIFQQNILKSIKYITLAEQDTNFDIMNILTSETKVYMQQTLSQHRQTSEDIVGEVTETEANSPLTDYSNMACNNCKSGSYNSIILLPNTLNFLDMSGLRIRSELKNICICEPNNIYRIDLSRNVFWKWQSPVTGLSGLLDLDLSWNSCDSISTDIFDNMTMLIQLNLTRNFFDRIISEDVDGRLFRGLTSLLDLLLSDMKLRYLPPKMFKSLTKLRGLDLSNNFLTEFEVDLSDATQLQYLNLHRNFIKKLEANVMDRLSTNADNFTTYIDLSDNMLSCTCNDTEFIKWFYETKVYFVGYYSYMCTYNNEKTINMSANLDLSSRLEKDCADYTTLIFVILSLIILFFILTLVAIGYRFRWDLRYFYYSAKLRMNGKVPLIDRNDENATFGFDAFVSYSRENATWVKNVIVPMLEEERNLRLLVHDRDFLAGNFVNDNIMGAITTSRKTLVIMSNEFLRSEWCLFEMNMARMESIKTGRNVICVLMKEQVVEDNIPLEIMDAIRRSTYIEYYPNPERQAILWDRVKEALLD
ncbi:hypothetical protein ACF0H5_008815 [Mactra antiquata]